MGERDELKIFLAPEVVERYPSQPEYGRLYMKYTLLQSVDALSPKTETADLIRLLVAPEVMTGADAGKCKAEIKNQAVRLARLTLRREGKSFVVKNGVNPLVTKVQPVIDALNAPDCRGLEEAFRNLGADVPDCERGVLKKVAEGWAWEIMSGDVAGEAAGRYLPKMAIAFGADGYNRFVDEYNNGKEESK